jgi:DUF4097 and DUF4098 domain-containing protein YvlB
MNALIQHACCRRSTCWAALLSLLLVNQPAVAETSIDERQDAAAEGHVEVINISGAVEVTGWEEDQVAITGTLGRGVERLDFSVDGDQTRIEVIYPQTGRSEGSDLQIRIPAGSSLDVRTVSASINADDVTGRQWLNSVSGDITSEVFDSDLEAETVSGSLAVSGAAQPTVVALKTVSGNIEANAVSGELEAGSVSGRIEVDAGMLDRARLGTTSGRITLDGGLASGGRYDLSTTSGRVSVMLDHDADLDLDAQSFSGRIENCFGLDAEREGYSPERSLRYRAGEGDRTVRIRTMSSRIEICAESLSG